MAIKAIIELQPRTGKQEEFQKALEEFHESRKNAPGFLGVTIYEVLDDPDILVEISEWDSREARQKWIEKSMELGVINRLVSTLKDSFKATTVRQIK